MKIFQLLDLIIRLFRLNKDKKAKAIIFGLLSYHAQVQSQIASAFWLGTTEEIEVPCDDNYDKVSLLLHMDGSNNSTVFLDNSVNDFVVSPSGNARISTAQSVFGGTSASFDGTGDFITTPSDAAFNYGTGDFTIEGWFRNPASTTTRRTIFSQSSGTSVSGLVIETYATGIDANRVYFGGYSSGTAVFNLQSAEISATQWYHFAAVKSGTTYSFYINGVSQGSFTTATAIPYDNKNVVIGALTDNTGRDYWGFIDEVRVTKGLARYTSNFTVPTVAFENVDCAAPEPEACDEYFYSNSLLLHMDGANNATTFTDNSINNFTPTVFGNAQISTAQSKFGGSSLLLDGSGDYLSYASNTDFDYGTGDFTIEGWFRATNVSLSQTVFSQIQGNLGVSGIVIRIFSSKIAFNPYTPEGDPVFVLGDISTISSNTWYHVAVTKSGTTYRIFLNGILEDTHVATLTPVWNGKSPKIGTWQDIPGRDFSGHIDDFRITKGVARYTSNFTPPTAPFEDVSCTQLWDGSQTGILDNYPGAAAAYSVRALNSNYTGPLMTIRRASDNAEADVYALASGDLDVAWINSFCSGTSCTVRTWYDQSGNGRDAIKSTAAQQAIIYQSGAIITENSKPALRPVAAPGYATNVSGLTDFCIIVIGNNSPGVSNSPLTRFVTSYEGTGSVQSNEVISDYTGTAFRVFAGVSFVSVTAPSSIDFVSFANRAGTSTNIDVNGGTYQNTANLTMTSSKALYLFEDKAGLTFTETARGFNEFIIYNSSQLTNKSGLLSNINTYYSIY